LKSQRDRYESGDEKRMSLRFSLKWVIYIVLIFGAITIIPPLVAGNYSDAGGALVKWGFGSVVILLLGTWDEYTAAKEKQEKQSKPISEKE
jgi:hypothetical protein